MRLPTPLIMCVLVATAAPASGASRTDHDNCNASDPERNIVGCTRILADVTESKTTRAIASVSRGLAWESRGDHDRAIADFTYAITLNPNDALAYNNRGLAWREKQDVDRAIADFTDAIRINPLPRSDMAASGHVNIHTNRGLAWWAKGDFDRAFSDFDRAISLDHEDADAYRRRSQAFIEKGDLDHAVADLDELIRIDPKSADARYRRGVIRYQRYMGAGAWIEQADLDGAIADLPTLRLNERRQWLLCPRSQDTMGRDRAIADSEALRLDPTDGAYYARAFAWNNKGDRDRAIADLTEAVRLNPYDEQKVAALKQLNPDYTAPSLKGFLGFPETPKK